MSVSNRTAKPPHALTAWSALFVVCAVLISPVAPAQTHGHQHPDLSDTKPRPIPPVRYNFRGEVKPDSTLVRGLLEVEYANQTSDSLNEIRFFCATPMIDPHDSTASVDPPYLKLDSVLSYGVPLSDDELRIDGHSMSVVMSRPLPPNDRAFFIMTFETQLKSGDVLGVTFTEWYPKVSAYHDGRWYDQYDSILDQAVPEFADFAVALSIDSAYSLVYPGELINDKEHYGLLPPAHNDSVYVDIVNRHQQEYAGIKYKPVFESGRKNFYIRSKNDVDFSFVAGKNLLRDRAYVDSLTIEVCYPPELSGVWAGFVARDAKGLVRSLEKLMGKYPYQALRIAAVKDADCSPSGRQCLVIPTGVTDTLLLRTVLCMQLARCWVSPALPVDEVEDALFDDGLAYYAGIEGLERYRRAGYGDERLARWGTDQLLSHDTYYTYFLIHEFEQWLMTATDNSVYRMYLQVDSISDSDADVVTAIETPMRRIPSMIHTLRSCIGYDNLWKVYRRYLEASAYRPLLRSDFEEVVHAVTDSQFVWFFPQFEQPSPIVDYDIVNDNSLEGLPATAFEYELKLRNRGNVILPVTISYVCSNLDRPGIFGGRPDTVTYEYQKSRGPISTVKLSLPAAPVYITVDPGWQLPDADRSSNTLKLPETNIELRGPSQEHPAYTDLRSVLDD